MYLAHCLVTRLGGACLPVLIQGGRFTGLRLALMIPEWVPLGDGTAPRSFMLQALSQRRKEASFSLWI